MIITFKYKNDTYTHQLKNNVIKIYEVPKEYSSDELYIADYKVDAIEPLPSSDSTKTKLLFYGIFKKTYNIVKMNELEEVVYA